MNRRVSVKARTTVQWSPWRASNDVAFESTLSGVGRGEQKMLRELHLMGDKGALRGGYENSYDILDSRGQRWEVKEVDSNLEIRPGKDGIRSADELVDVLRDIVVDLDHLFERYESRRHQLLSNFVYSGKSKIIEGSIPKGMVFGQTHENPVGLIALLDDLAWHVLNSDRTMVQALIQVGRSKAEARQFELLDLLKILPDMDAADVSVAERMYKEIREMKHASYILNPQMIAELWRTSSLPSKAFKYVSGLILVNEFDGYSIVPLKSIDKHMRFERITAGKSKFKLLQHPTKGTKKGRMPVQTEFEFMRDM